MISSTPKSVQVTETSPSGNIFQVRLAILQRQRIGGRAKGQKSKLSIDCSDYVLNPPLLDTKDESPPSHFELLKKKHNRKRRASLTKRPLYQRVLLHQFKRTHHGKEIMERGAANGIKFLVEELQKQGVVEDGVWPLEAIIFLNKNRKSPGIMHLRIQAYEPAAMVLAETMKTLRGLLKQKKKQTPRRRSIAAHPAMTTPIRV